MVQVTLSPCHLLWLHHPTVSRLTRGVSIIHFPPHRIHGDLDSRVISPREPGTLAWEGDTGGELEPWPEPFRLDPLPVHVIQ